MARLPIPMTYPADSQTHVPTLKQRHLHTVGQRGLRLACQSVACPAGEGRLAADSDACEICVVDVTLPRTWQRSTSQAGSPSRNSRLPPATELAFAGTESWFCGAVWCGFHLHHSLVHRRQFTRSKTQKMTCRTPSQLPRYAMLADCDFSPRRESS